MGLKNDKWCAPPSAPLNVKTQAWFSDLTATSLGFTVLGNKRISSLASEQTFGSYSSPCQLISNYDQFLKGTSSRLLAQQGYR